MKARLIMAAVCAATLTLSACGSEQRTGTPAAATSAHKETKYGEEEFLKDIRKAGWHPENPAYANEEGMSGERIAYGLYLEAYRICKDERGGEEAPGTYLEALREALEFSKAQGIEPASANVDAYLAATKKTCGLK